MLQKFNRLLAFAAALFVGFGVSAEQPVGQETKQRTMAPAVGGDQNAVIERAIRRRQLAMARQAAAERARPAREAAKAARAATGTKKAALVGGVKPQLGVAPAPPGILNPLGVPDYMGGVVPNYANTPAIRKFVDTLPGLGSGNANNLGNFIPVGVPDRATFPGSDYYNIDLVDYTQQLHSDLPPTHLRGYQVHQTSVTNGAPATNYLGPVIVANRDVPVRVKFNNRLPLGAAGNLKIPVDTTLMGAGTGPTDPFTQNRAELHLHGGLSPWISDGTPHQWFTPAGEAGTNLKGVSFRNVPDMGAVIPGGYPGAASDGVGTYFYTNAQSGRFMFYHDHTFGLTRLNVYSGEAAGYLIVDPKETELINAGILPSAGTALPIANDPWDATPGAKSLYNGGSVYTYGIPLVVQDKTFVPGLADLAAQDPTWDTTNWGGFGDLWYPHVYMTNQNPGDPSGANAMGRWDYGPWFWPPVPVANAPNSIPTAHGPVPQVVNGVTIDTPGTPNPSLTPEAFMDTPVINGTPYPTVTLEPKAYRFRLLNAANDRMFAFAFYYADPAAPTEVKMIPATPANNVAAAADFAVKHPGDPNIPNWPVDGRDGGVVDFATAGPDIIQIGNESGFLPSPVIWHCQPTNYNYNRRDIVVLDIAEHGLFLGPAERADIIVDFSSVPSGSTLILYNDMLAPVPAFDVRYDYFTGAPDQTFQGGAPPTPAGYGPNTRTLMQVKVAGTPAAPFNLAGLQAAFKSTPTSKGAFAASQHTPIVPQTFYNDALGTTFPADLYSTIQATSLTYSKTENGVTVTEPFQPKAIQELFELDYGRMNATLGVELPFTNFNNQTTIPLGYSELATEIVADGKTTFWKITHNGVDTHPVHFHLFDVQILNRVGWDGAVRFPEANEIGWKETVKMKPLEDIVVAMRPISPKLPFPLGNSTRNLDPTKPANARVLTTDLGNHFVNLGNLGNQIEVSNSNGLLGATANLDTTGAGYDYGWEYVWHCHILGHEENDFMRPLVLKVATTPPAAPTTLSAVSSGPTRVDLAWTKVANAPNVAPPDGVPVPVDETGFRVERKTGVGAFAVIGTTVPDENHFADMTAVSGTTYDYRVYSYNQAGDSTIPATASTTPGAITNPTTVALAASPVTTAPVGMLVTFTATPAAVAAHQFQFLVNGLMVQDYSATATYSFPLTQAAGTYSVTVNARTSVASTIATATIPYIITPGKATGVQLLPNLPSPQLAGKVKFTATGIGSTGYQYQFSVDSVVVQAYSATNTYSDAYLADGLHQIKVDVRTNTASVVPDASAVLSYTFAVPPNPTGLVVTTSVPSPQITGNAVTFNAAGQGSGGYLYAFHLSNDGGTTFSLVQPFSPTASWTLPASTPAGSYIVAVEVKTSVAGAIQTQWVGYNIILPAPTGLVVGTTLPSPQTAGTAVTFNALGLGSSGYLYAFHLSSNGGATFTLVQPFSSTASWTLPASTAAGNYVIAVEVRTSMIGAIQTQWIGYRIDPPPPTGLIVTTSLPSPQLAGTLVTFNAAGQGSSGYLYAFHISSDGGNTFSLVQAFSPMSSWTLPASIPAGNYIIAIEVRTSMSGTIQTQWIPFTLN